jgi:SAM-dependent methyltransferase
MFGSREEFVYVECPTCGSLSLAEIPESLRPYYPADYYSFEAGEDALPGGLRARLRRVRARALVRLPRPLVKLVGRTGRIPSFFDWLAGLGYGLDASFCDVGCGGGDLLATMRGQGFTRLVGADPFLDRDRVVAGDVPLYKRDLHELTGSYDVLMLHHVLEHLVDPVRALSSLRGSLTGGGAIVVRTPVCDSYAWRHYGVDWVQLDPPRHLVVPTRDAMALLAARAGLRIDASFDDSTAFQFWGSEQYRNDVPLRDRRSFAEAGTSDLFTSEELAAWERSAKQLNAARDGDSACFVLKPI